MISKKGGGAIKASPESAWRFELKYRLNYLQYNKIKIAVKPYMQPDYYSRIAPGRRYLVRSLYFDSYDYHLYHEKMSGDSDRVKFRLRSYSATADQNPLIKAELKVRQSNAMEKYSAPVTVEQYSYFMAHRHWPENDDPVLSEFERALHLKDLKPQVLVQYRREGLEDRIKNGLRITFDHNVASVHSASLFPVGPSFFRAHHYHNVVLEIKCRDTQPTWLRDLVRDYGLRLLANSKFTQGIQVARHNLHHPDGVIIVR